MLLPPLKTRFPWTSSGLEIVTAAEARSEVPLAAVRLPVPSGPLMTGLKPVAGVLLAPRMMPPALSVTPPVNRFCRAQLHESAAATW